MEEKDTITSFIKEHTVVTQVKTLGAVKTIYGEKFEFSPGNGLLYRIIAIPVENLELGILGAVDKGYLVVNGQNGRAHLFSDHGYLTSGYVSSHLYKMDDKFSVDEIQVITALIGFALGRETTIKKFNGSLRDIETQKEISLSP